MTLQLIIDRYDLSEYYKPGSISFADTSGSEINKLSFILEMPHIPDMADPPLVHNPTFPASIEANMVPSYYTGPLKRFRPVSGMIVSWRDTEDPDGLNIFVGAIVRRPGKEVAVDEDGDGVYRYRIDVAGPEQTLDGHKVTDIYDNKQTGFIFADILKNKAPDFDCSEIPISGSKAGRYRRPQYVIQRRTVRQVLDDLAATEGWTWFVEETEPRSLTNHKKVRLGPPVRMREPFEITDDNVREICTEMPEIDIGDLTQVRNVIHYSFYGEYTTLYSGTGSTTDPLNYDKGLARIGKGDTAVAPLGEANWAAYVTAGAVFQIPGSNYRYTVAQVMPNGHVILNSPILDESGDVPYAFSNIPAVIKLRDQKSIKILKELYNNGDDGEREFEEGANQMMTFEQAIKEAQSKLSDRANPMVRLEIKTDTYKLRTSADWSDGPGGISGTKFYPKAGKAVQFRLLRQKLTSLQTEKRITWRDTGADDADYRRVYELTIDFNDRLFDLVNIFRKLIDGQSNAFGQAGGQVVQDVLDLNETIKLTNPDFDPRENGVPMLLEDGTLVWRRPLLGSHVGEVVLVDAYNTHITETIPSAEITRISRAFVVAEAIPSTDAVAMRHATLINEAISSTEQTAIALPRLALLENLTPTDTITMGSLVVPAGFHWVDSDDPVPDPDAAKWGEACWVDVP